jgi:hypothetical protein
MQEWIETGTEKYPITPDGRYFVVRGRLWRMSNPHLSEAQRKQWVGELMDARRRLAKARRPPDPEAAAAARRSIQAAKEALGERGPVWWTDGAPDYNRYLAKNTPYAEWFASLELSQNR